jgi:hypothetical protein
MIERDALALTWHLKVRVPEVDLSRAACPDVSDAVDRATASGATVRLFETTTDCEIPAYLALSVSDEAGPAVTAGAAANIHGCRAARKASLKRHSRGRWLPARLEFGPARAKRCRPIPASFLISVFGPSGIQIRPTTRHSIFVRIVQKNRSSRV